MTICTWTRSFFLNAEKATKPVFVTLIIYTISFETLCRLQVDLSTCFVLLLLIS